MLHKLKTILRLFQLLFKIAFTKVCIYFYELYLLKSGIYCEPAELKM